MSGVIGSELEGRYRIVRRIGAGGMGTVYEAVVRKSGARVAIKTLNTEYADRADAAARFRREARAASSIVHPCVVRTLDLGVTGEGLPYLVMELLDGAPLSVVLERTGAPDHAAVFALLRATLQGLVAAHAAGVIHRDLKPENVFVHHGPDAPDVPDLANVSVKIVDFGISKVRGAESMQLTNTGMILGTPCYMAPEQARGDSAIDARADLYAIGAIGYELVSGVRPFHDVAPQALLMTILRGRPKPVRSFSPKCPPGLEAWIARAMAPERDDRFASAQAALEALEATGKGLVTESEMTQALVRLGYATRERPLPQALRQPEVTTLPMSDGAESAANEAGERKSLPTLIADGRPSTTPGAGHAPSGSGSTQRRALASALQRKRDARVAIAVVLLGIAASSISNLTALGPRLRHLSPLDAFSSGPSAALGGILVSLAWFALAQASVSARSRGFSRPLAVLGVSQGIYHVHLALLSIAPHFARSFLVNTIGHGSIMFVLPAAVELTARLASAEAARFRRLVLAAYVVAIAIGSLGGTHLWSRYIDGGREVAGPILLVLGPVGAVIITIIVVVLTRAAAKIADVDRRRRARVVAVGIPLYGILCIGNILPLIGVRMHFPSLLSILPIGMIAYGALGAEAMTREGVERALLIGQRLALGFIGIYVASFVVLFARAYTPQAHLAGALFPGLTALAALTVAWRALSVDTPTSRTFLCGVSMGVVGILKLVFIFALVGSEMETVWFSRAAHAAFVFGPATMVHLLRLTTRREGERWALWMPYVLALTVSPLALSEGYFIREVRHYWYGSATQAGWGFAIFFSFTGGAWAYALMVAITGVRRAVGRERRARLLAAIGFVMTATLLMTDSQGVSGRATYPLGNFAFIPLVVFAYGVLQSELTEFGSFVRASFVHGIASTALTAGMAATLVLVTRVTSSAGLIVGALAAASIATITVEPLRQLVQAGLDRLLGVDRFDEASAFRALVEASSGMVRLVDIADAARRIVDRTVASKSSALLLPTEDGGFARGPYAIESSEPALLEIRRTLEPVRCGARGHDGASERPTPAGLVGLGEVVLIPIAHRGRLYGILAICPSARAPLVGRRANEFLRAYADHVALILENVTITVGVDREIERRTRELSEVVARLEKKLAAGVPDSENERRRAMNELREGLDALRRSNYAIDPAEGAALLRSSGLDVGAGARRMETPMPGSPAPASPTRSQVVVSSGGSGDDDGDASAETVRPASSA